MVETKHYLTKNECYIVNGRIVEHRGVLIHSTATPGATPERFASLWDTYRPSGKQVCVHAFSDDTKVINTLPYNVRCWGCGSGPKGSGNSYYIQVEICEPAGIYFSNGWQYKIKEGREQEVKDYITKAVDVVAEWAVNRLLELGIKEVTPYTVTSHYEANTMGIASNHGDPKGLLGLAGLTMDDLRNKCKAIMAKRLGDSGITGNTGSNTDNTDKGNNSNIIKVGSLVGFNSNAVQWNGKAIPASYKTKEYTVSSIGGNGRAVLNIGTTVMYAVDIKYLHLIKADNPVVDCKDYLVKVTADNLNVRKGPGTSYPVVMSIKDRGVYTIVEQLADGSWGKLKSGAGWINLTYTKRV